MFSGGGFRLKLYLVAVVVIFQITLKLNLTVHSMKPCAAGYLIKALVVSKESARDRRGKEKLGAFRNIKRIRIGVLCKAFSPSGRS